MPRSRILNVLYNVLVMPDHVMGTRRPAEAPPAPALTPHAAAAQSESSAAPLPADTLGRRA